MSRSVWEEDAYGREEIRKLISPYSRRKRTDWEKKASCFVRVGSEKARTKEKKQAGRSVRG